MSSSELPLDVRLMTAVTRGLVAVLAVLCLGALGTWVARWPVWTLRAIAVQGEVSHQNAVGLRAQLASSLRRIDPSFLTVDLQVVRQLFESVPWVRHVRVQREFPNGLSVTLQEHVAVAWWGQSGSGQLVSREGVVFDASPDDGDEFPVLAGAVDQAPLIWQTYQLLSAEMERLDRSLVRLDVDERGSWHAELDNGAHIELGRGSQEELLARTRRFTSTVGQLALRYPGPLQSVDLRYPNGYALRMQGVTTVTDDESQDRKPNR